MGSVPSTDMTSVMLGLHPGPMGTLNGLVLLACMLYLAARGSIRLWQRLITLGWVAVFAAFFPRAAYPHWPPCTMRFWHRGAVRHYFHALGADDRRHPGGGPALSSIVAGLLLVGYNYFGAYQQGILFVVLLMNIINHHIDTVTEKRMQKERRARYAKREAVGDQ